MKRLIVNAAGFGFTFGNNKGILEALPYGLIKSVSVNVTWPAVEEVTRLARDFPDVSIGLHWNLSVGPPVCDPKAIPSLVGSNGEFFADEFPRRCMKRLFDLEDMKRELRAQARKLRDTGVKILHWATHQSRFLYPQFYEAARDVALEMGLLVVRTPYNYLAMPPGPRWLRLAQYYRRRPSQVYTHWVGSRKAKTLKKLGFRMADYALVLASWGPKAVGNMEAWKDQLRRLPDGVGVTVCHPGHPDETLRKYSVVIDSRKEESTLFSSDALTRCAQESGIELVSHAVLEGAQA